MFCDIHGHSAKKSVFIYGCGDKKMKFKQRRYGSVNENPKLFPFMISNNNNDFNYNFCNFTV